MAYFRSELRAFSIFINRPFLKATMAASANDFFADSCNFAISEYE